MNSNTFTIARKKVYTDNFDFTTNPATVTFTDENDTELLRVIIEKIATEYDDINVFKMTYAHGIFNDVTIYINKSVIGKSLDEKEFNGRLYSIQKKVGEAYASTKLTEAPESTEAPKNPETPTVEFQLPVEAPKTAREQVTVKIERPKTVGLEGQIHELVYSCLESDYTVQTIQNKMIELGLEPNRTEIVLKSAEKAPKNVGSQHKDFTKILQTLKAGVNVAIVGPAGSGKTTAVKHVAEALELKFYSKSVSAQTGSHEFFGYQDANGNYVRTLFREAYEFGGVFLLDEFDAGNPNVLASMNQATANGQCAFADGMINKHEDFIIVMAGNTFGHGATSEYVGRNKIDAATLDRFAFIYFDYDEAFEYQLASNKSWCKIVQDLRKKVADKRIKTIISPRATFDGSKLLSVGMDIETVKQLLIYKGLSNDEINLLK